MTAMPETGDGTECVELWDCGMRDDVPEGVTIELRVWGSLELKARLAAAIEEVLETGARSE